MPPDIFFVRSAVISSREQNRSVWPTSRYTQQSDRAVPSSDARWRKSCPVRSRLSARRSPNPLAVVAVGSRFIGRLTNDLPLGVVPEVRERRSESSGQHHELSHRN